ncbi:hypothetical protein HanRHA438_Chr13g0610581 [Helianthus annuus]|uniref:Uncharacterized protein n=1 Tax=Helianthus annuus TaxID=4232 RepID=A0A9K3HCW4_HELAN|nr:hypothetical protein HanXRQr2_Chr13g0599981 [Helianthus annuus]KAJ0477753.1 hypothetical protein HanHA300_Chr13g0492211 [Helianthus annuus]KAJ0482327.1 hypothetical protein HanIR_Chr13g0652681 [Helianthus annuus]KAJ0498585.1 hypothetical protein HanHA89_Chr13g0524331 [Helianthus annuus]KAJ0664599.1 hypothetical protein HanLR1_Chr13g0494331 [Helianthus annuus]
MDGNDFVMFVIVVIVHCSVVHCVFYLLLSIVSFICCHQLCF